MRFESVPAFGAVNRIKDRLMGDDVSSAVEKKDGVRWMLSNDPVLEIDNVRCEVFKVSEDIETDPELIEERLFIRKEIDAAIALFLDNFEGEELVAVS